MKLGLETPADPEGVKLSATYGLKFVANVGEFTTLAATGAVVTVADLSEVNPETPLKSELVIFEGVKLEAVLALNLDAEFIIPVGVFTPVLVPELPWLKMQPSFSNLQNPCIVIFLQGISLAHSVLALSILLFASACFVSDGEDFKNSVMALCDFSS